MAIFCRFDNMQVLVTKKNYKEISKIIEDEFKLLSFIEQIERLMLQGYGSYLNYDEEMLKNTKTTFELETKQETRRFLVMYELISEIQNSIKLMKDNDELLDKILNSVFENSKEYSKKEIYENSFIKNIKIDKFTNGKYTLDKNNFVKGELFVHNKDYIEDLFHIPSLGYCKSDFIYPCIRVENYLYYFVSPEVINKYEHMVSVSEGNILCLGLGIGYFPYMVSLKDNVDSITIVEKDPELIDLFTSQILPQFENKNKIKIIKADPLNYIHKLKENDFNYCMVDISANPSESLKSYIYIKRLEKRLKNINFIYYDETRILLDIREFIMVEILCDVTNVKKSESIITDKQLQKILYDLYENMILIGTTDIQEVTNLENIKKYILDNA
jgi:hypothetical protein